MSAAVRDFRSGAPTKEACPFCGEPLLVEGMPPAGPFTQWAVHCKCGRCNTTLKGL